VAAGAYWRCPICLRRVPGKVTECYCGRKRQPGDGPDDAGDGRSGAGALWLGLLALLVVGAGAYMAVRPAPLPPSPASSRPPPVDLAPPIERSVPTGLPTPLEAPPELPGPFPQTGEVSADPLSATRPTPRPTPTATPSDSVDARREQGRLAFDVAVQNLRGRLDVLRRRLGQLDTSCPAAARNVVGCDDLRREIASDAQQIQAAVEQAEEQARRSWVDPGVIRDLRERHGLREGDVRGLLARVEEALLR